MKYIANHLVAIHNVAAGEAMTLASKAGLDLQQVLDVVAGGAGGSRMFQVRGPMMVANDYSDATMKVEVWQKDMHIIGEFATAARLPGAAVRHLRADLHGRDGLRLREGRHRRGLRRAGRHGRREARSREEAQIRQGQEEQEEVDSRRGPVTGPPRGIYKGSLPLFVRRIESERHRRSRPTLRPHYVRP